MVVCDDEESGVRAACDFAQKVTESRHVGVVKRRVDLVQNADRRRVGQEHRENDGKCGKRLLAA